MRELARLITTMFIWGMAGGIMLAALLSNNVQGGTIIPLVMFLSLGAAVSTIGIWVASLRSEAGEAMRSKSKRVQSNRVQRLINDLDDDEIYDLEALLLARERPHERSQRDY